MNKKSLTALSLAALSISHSAFAGEEMTPIETSSSACCAWSLGVEVLYLKAHQSEGGFDEYSAQDEELSYRLEAAYKQEGNLGIRARFFEFKGSDGKDSMGEYWYPELKTVDLEAFDNFELGSFQGEYAFGLRYLSYQEPYDGSFEVDYQGIGPTLALDLVRPISESFAAYVNSRLSLVYGDDDVTPDSKTAIISEIGLGVQYEFGDCKHNVRLGVEAQNYGGVSDDDGEDTGLFGAVVGFNFNF